MFFDILGIWVASLLTLAIFSFLYKDNPVYKFAEHLFVGLSAGYGIAFEWHSVFIPNLWNPLVKEEKFILIIPFALGLLLFARFLKNIGWMSRWAISLMVGSYAGLAVIGFAQGDLVSQIQGNMIPPISVKAIGTFQANPGTGTFLEIFTNPLLIIGLLSTLVFFFFSVEHKGIVGKTARVGIWFLMISFGASFGYTVMARISLLIGRLQFLLSDWLHLIK